MSKVGRKYFFALMLVTMVFVTGFFLSGFPYDNLCENKDSVVDPKYVGTWEIQTVESQSEGTSNWFLSYFVDEDKAPDSTATDVVTVEPDDRTYRYCSQDFLRDFWDSEDEFFTEDQKIVNTIYVWTAIAVLALAVLWFTFKASKNIRRLFHRKYKEVRL